MHYIQNYINLQKQQRYKLPSYSLIHSFKTYRYNSMYLERHEKWIRKRFPIFYTIKIQFPPQFLSEEELQNIEKQLFQEKKLITDISKQSKNTYKKLKKLATDTQKQFKCNKDLYTTLEKTKPDQIRQIILNQKGISNLQPLTGMQFSKMTDIQLSRNQISDITPLTSCVLPNIFMVNLTQNKIKTLKHIEQCNWDSLKCLKLDMNMIQNIELLSFGSFESLKSLDLSNNRIRNIGSYHKLKTSKNVSCINFQGNKINDVSMFFRSQFVRLDSLNLSKNMISNINNLEKVQMTNEKAEIIKKQKIKSYKQIDKNGEQYFKLSQFLHHSYSICYSSIIDIPSKQQLALFCPQKNSIVCSKHFRYSKIQALEKQIIQDHAPINLRRKLIIYDTI